MYFLVTWREEFRLEPCCLSHPPLVVSEPPRLHLCLNIILLSITPVLANLLHTQPAAREPLLHNSRTQGVSEQKCNLNNVDEEKLNLI